MQLLNQAQTLGAIPDSKLIRRFSIKEKNKIRNVNDPIPELKTVLKEWNVVITDYYQKKIKLAGISDIPHAYLPGKSIKTNASSHTSSEIIQFDFKGFYDSCKFEYFIQDLIKLDPSMNESNWHLIKRLLIDPKTGGLTQGLPVSGALAGLCLVPFWIELRQSLPENIIFTQYSDDLTFSYTSQKPQNFTIQDMTQVIKEALCKSNLSFRLNINKTRIEKNQYRKITGVRINHKNQMTPSRKDYRFLRSAFYILSKSENLEKELHTWGFKSKSAFIGKISYMRSIDTTNKINNLINHYKTTCLKHGLFTSWLSQCS